MTKVTICRDGIWAGEGRWTDDCEIVDCPAVLGSETYEALCEALAALPQDEQHWRGPVSVERPDGTYTAELCEATAEASA